MLRNLFRKLYLKFTLKRNPVKYAQLLGVKVGAGTRFMGAKEGMFSTEPYLIEIGKNCLITSNVQFITHDGSVYHLKSKNPKVDLIGRICVGDNVFIGYQTIILPNVSIGSNVVIGAGAVVAKSIPPNSVAVGVPAKVIYSLDEYLNKIEPLIIETGGLSYDKKKEILLKKFNIK